MIGNQSRKVCKAISVYKDKPGRSQIKILEEKKVKAEEKAKKLEEEKKKEKEKAKETEMKLQSLKVKRKIDNLNKKLEDERCGHSAITTVVGEQLEEKDKKLQEMAKKLEALDHQEVQCLCPGLRHPEEVN